MKSSSGEKWNGKLMNAFLVMNFAFTRLIFYIFAVLEKCHIEVPANLILSLTAPLYTHD
jgi:hypothetical protein